MQAPLSSLTATRAYAQNTERGGCCTTSYHRFATQMLSRTRTLLWPARVPHSMCGLVMVRAAAYGSASYYKIMRGGRPFLAETSAIYIWHQKSACAERSCVLKPRTRVDPSPPPKHHTHTKDASDRTFVREKKTDFLLMKSISTKKTLEYFRSRNSWRTSRLDKRSVNTTGYTLPPKFPIIQVPARKQQQPRPQGQSAPKPPRPHVYPPAVCFAATAVPTGSPCRVQAAREMRRPNAKRCRERALST